MSIVVKRVYEPAKKTDGYRVLVDRVWPRGLKKEDAALDIWARELAPTTALRRWFGHDPARWEGFRHRYASELDARKTFWQPLVTQAERHPVTLLFGAKDEEHNQAVALKMYLDSWIKANGLA
ncbi:DUF488 domain-containing protein [Dyella mobilis]|uniref:DUF488 family protein n=1 Tax=Dyella mobilis TaxID=1849582 RepID=A0ABS2KEZ9_9GAMM|nr:DUF488 family protein [Dyella mobilis]MBM7129744.1 DUF488 family protein [Dyella mobilis]GLQ97991.1 hypothetical protein GCM10007863_24110 [Dyella mobilis]